MNEATIHPANEEDVLFVASRLRAADRMELETATGLDPVSAVVRSVQVSELVFTGHIDGVPAVVFGAGPGGIVWMVCTDAIRAAKRTIFELSKVVISAFLRRYPRLWNQADCRNHLHLRWLERLGCTLDEVVEVNGMPFRRFHIDRED